MEPTWRKKNDAIERSIHWSINYGETKFSHLKLQVISTSDPPNKTLCKSRKHACMHGVFWKDRWRDQTGRPENSTCYRTHEGDAVLDAWTLSSHACMCAGNSCSAQQQLLHCCQYNLMIDLGKNVINFTLFERTICLARSYISSTRLLLPARDRAKQLSGDVVSFNSLSIKLVLR